jgi:hypothetical protein
MLVAFVMAVLGKIFYFQQRSTFQLELMNGLMVVSRLSKIGLWGS